MFSLPPLYLPRHQIYLYDNRESPLINTVVDTSSFPPHAREMFSTGETHVCLHLWQHSWYPQLQTPPPSPLKKKTQTKISLIFFFPLQEKQKNEVERKVEKERKRKEDAATKRGRKRLSDLFAFVQRVFPSF